MKNEKMYYLAHPYTATKEKSVETHLAECRNITNELIDLGYIIYAPILMTHEIHLEKPRPAKFWYEYDLKMLKKCDGIFMPVDYQKSKGCELEHEFAADNHIKIRFYEYTNHNGLILRF